VCVIFLFRHFASLAHVYIKMPKKKKNKKLPQAEQDNIINAEENEALTHNLIPPSDTNLTTFFENENHETDHETDAAIKYDKNDENVEHNVLEDDDVNSVVSKTSSGSNCFLKFEFTDPIDRIKYRYVCKSLFACIYVLLLAHTVLFFSSIYPSQLHNSEKTIDKTIDYAADAFVFTANQIIIDLSTCLFVCFGFFSSHLYINLEASQFKDVQKICILCFLIDLWIATIASVIFGSLYHLTRFSFAYQNIALTLLEGLFCLRVFEIDQAKEKWHSLNPPAWIIMCFVFCLILLPLTWRCNERFVKFWRSGGFFLIVGNSVLPIAVLTFFALINDNSNVFYANFSQLGLKLLEYNAGVSLYQILWHNDEQNIRFLTKTFAVLQRLKPITYFVFCMLWSSELGSRVPQHEENICVRLYSFCPCMLRHNGFVSRGIFLALVYISSIVADDVKINEITENRNKHNSGNLHAMPQNIFDIQSSSAEWIVASFCALIIIWPACYIVEMLLELNFSRSLASKHSMLLVFLMPHIALFFSYLWIKTIKLPLFFNLEIILDKILNQIRSIRNGNCCTDYSLCVMRFFSCTFQQSYTKANDITRDLEAV